MGRVLLGATLAAALAVLLTYQAVLQAAGTFLAVSDPLASADAVIAVSGDGRERVETASRLLQQGYARWLLLSGGPGRRSGSGAELRRYAHAAGVSDDRILLDETAVSTVGNATGSACVMRAHGLRSAILVTSPYHMRRAAVIFRSVFGKYGLTVRAYAVPDSFFTVDRWWERRPDRGLVIGEYLKLIAFLVGVDRMGGEGC